MEPDLTQFTCPGRVRITIELDTPTREVVLNAHELEIETVSAQHGDAPQVSCEFSLESADQLLRVVLPREEAGVLLLEIHFQARLNDSLVGFYRSAYELDGETRHVATTQFEETDARRAFPCFDHPALKATFDVELVVDEAHVAIANTPVAEEVPVAGGRKCVRFERTPKMSTYLLCFCVGAFELLEDTRDGLQVRVAATPGKTQYGQFALDFGRKSLRFCEQFTGVSFPIAKCDFIAVPGFAFGAMENYAAITFRENLLLVYPGVTSRSTQERIAEIIAHEVAHQWFGNLVTPADWHYIWLNESFASLFNFLVPDHYFPERDLWQHFHVTTTTRALRRDGLPSSFAIQLPAGQAVAISPASYPIIYSKGAAILRTLIAYLGETQFKKGVHHFLETHQFGTATTEEYWAAFEEATGAPITEFAASWVHQPGYPLVSVERAGTTLRLVQAPFQYLPAAASTKTAADPPVDPPVDPPADPLAWTIPLTYRLFYADGRTETRRVLVTGRQQEVSLPEGVQAVKVNADQMGFFRVVYPAGALAKLGTLAREGRLSPYDRFGLETDLFALVRAGRESLASYLAFVEDYCAAETTYLPLRSICSHLGALYGVDPACRERVQPVGHALLSTVGRELGFAPGADDPFLLGMARDTLLWTAHLMAVPEARTYARDQFARLLAGEAVHENVAGAVCNIGAVTHPDALAYFKERLSAPDTPEPERIRLTTALGHLPSLELLTEALTFTLTRVSKQNQVYFFLALSSNLAARDRLWDLFESHISDIAGVHAYLLGEILLAVVAHAHPKDDSRVHAFCQAYARDHPEHRDTLQMALELRAVAAQLRAQCAEAPV